MDHVVNSFFIAWKGLTLPFGTKLVLLGIPEEHPRLVSSRMDDTGPSSMQHIDGINLAIQENTSALQPAAISALQVAQQVRQRHQQQGHVQQLQVNDE